MSLRRRIAGAVLAHLLLLLTACGNDPPTAPASQSIPSRAQVTVTSTRSHATTNPNAEAYLLGEGDTLSLPVTADAGYTVSPTVGGTCTAGTWSAGTYTTGAITANCTLAFTATLSTYTITLSADANVAASPATAQTVTHGATQSFTVTPAPGYVLSVAGTCPVGTLSAGVYVTGSITANCTVQFIATLGTVNVTATGDAQTAIAPNTPQSAPYGSTRTFTLTSNAGYSASVGGTCPAGTLVGSTYTTGALLANCTVAVTSTLLTSIVTPSADAHVNLSPNSAQTVNYGATQAFTVTPNAGYSLSPIVGGTCPAGSFAGSTYATGAVTANCSVSFAATLNWAGLRQQGAVGVPTEVQSVVVDTAGNVFIGGYTEGSLNGSPQVGDRDGFIAKYDASGTIVWYRNLGVASGYTTPHSIALAPNGDVYLGGSTYGGLNGNAASNGEDYFIAKYSSSGTLAWVHQSGANSQTTFLTGLAVDAAGNLYATGSTTTPLHGASQNGNFDLFVARYDASGVLTWIRQVGTGGLTSFGNAIKVDAAGNSYVAGATTGGIAGNTQAGIFDSVIARYDANGTRLWLRQFGNASKITTATGLAMDPSGNALLAGGTTGGLNGNAMSGGQDAYMAKYDASGAMLWVRQLGASTGDTASMAASSDAAGNGFIAGFTNVGLAGNTQTGTYDGFAAKFDPSGTLLWARQVGSTALTAANSIGTDTNGNAFFGGYTEGSLPGNTLAGTRDYWLGKYSASGVLQ